MLENCENTAILCLSVCISDVINKAGKCGKSIQYLCAFLNDVMSQPESRLSQHGCSLGSSDSKYFFCNTCMFFMFWGQLEPSLQFQWNLLSSKWQTDKHNEIDMRHFSVFFVVVFLFSSSIYMYIYYVQECIHTAALFYCTLSLLSHFFFLWAIHLWKFSPVEFSPVQLPWTCWNEGQLIEQIGQWWLF